MSGARPTGASPSLDGSSAHACSVRRAHAGDVPAAVAAVRELLVELGGEAPPVEAMEATTRELIERPQAGVVLIAELHGALVGVAAASYQLAIHTAGRYALLQDLWVSPEHRSGSIGAHLISALSAEARALGMPRIEVGLPSESFPRLEATRAFYVRNGFAPLGPRMRLRLT